MTVIIIVGSLVIFCFVVALILYRLGWKEKGNTIGALGTIWAAGIVAIGAVLTAYSIDFSSHSREAAKIRGQYKYILGGQYDLRWKLYIGAPEVFKGLTSSEQTALEGIKNSACLPRIIGESLESQGVYYEQIVQSSDQYTGKGEAAGCFYVANLFEKMNLQIIWEENLPQEPPNDPCVILGSRNVTCISPDQYNLKWYVEDGCIKKIGGNVVKKYRCGYNGCLQITRDYGILSKVRNAVSGNYILICEGVHSYGTLAVTRELTNNVSWINSELERELYGRKLREDHLFQILFEVEVIKGRVNSVNIVDKVVW
jgi:hypothetical protein